ncbi:hypothetical protein G6F68_015238 [Rhizopus microsporus]|nr:hypothetical protein G6F68_015238 [Rhizopus microsporus]
MHGAGAAVAYIDVVFERVVAAAQHRDRQAGIVLRHDGGPRADQHAGPGCTRRVVRQSLGAHARGDDERASAHLRLAAVGTGQGGLDAALARQDARHAGFQAQRHAGCAHAGVDVGRHLLAGHPGQHCDPIVGERIVIAQTAQAGAGFGQ